MACIVPPLDNPVQGRVTVGIASVLVRAANAERRYLLLVNDSDTAIYVSLDAAALLNSGIRLNALGGWYEMLEGQNLYLGAVSAISSAAAKYLTYVEAPGA
jgi:hypothetical protein